MGRRHHPRHRHVKRWFDFFFYFRVVFSSSPPSLKGGCLERKRFFCIWVFGLGCFSFWLFVVGVLEAKTCWLKIKIGPPKQPKQCLQSAGALGPQVRDGAVAGPTAYPGPDHDGCGPPPLNSGCGIASSLEGPWPVQNRSALLNCAHTNPSSWWASRQLGRGRCSSLYPSLSTPTGRRTSARTPFLWVDHGLVPVLHTQSPGPYNDAIVGSGGTGRGPPHKMGRREIRYRSRSSGPWPNRELSVF